MGVFTGFITGILFGIVLQRGRLCFNSAIRDLKLFKDNYLWKAVMLGIAIETLLFPLMAQAGWIHLNPKPFIPVGDIIGGLLFGFGMVLAGGCASGVTYRTGEGLTTAWLAAIFYGLFGAASKYGFLKPVVKFLRGPVYKINSPGGIYTEGKIGPTIATSLHINPWIPAIIFAAILLWYVFGTKTSERSGKGFNWITTGILAALVGGLAYYTSSHFGGRNYPLGITGGWISIFKTFTGGKLNWEGGEILGIIIGAFLSALASKEFKLRMPRNPMAYVQVVVGGAFLGIGAVTASGCNIGNFFSGVPHLAWGSLLASLFFVLGNWIMAYWLYGRR